MARSTAVAVVPDPVRRLTRVASPTQSDTIVIAALALAGSGGSVVGLVVAAAVAACIATYVAVARLDRRVSRRAPGSADRVPRHRDLR